MTRTLAILLTALTTAAVLVGCGGKDGTGPTPTRSISPSAGDNQTARISSAVPVAPAVIVRDGNGQPVAGITVTFAAETGGGSITGATATTNASGVAAVGSWTLGSAPVSNTLTATASGVTGSPVRFTATARLPYWTVLVYLAADNSLALDGISDIDEMEAAGLDPEVQVAIQAEFSPTYLAINGCNAACFNRPNFNTFRYFVSGQGPNVSGPNGAVTDLGNRNMIDPLQLREFISWGKQTYPAQHYAVVLWNHGGGYAGLLEDQTSATGLMSIGDLPTAFSGVGPIDVLNFDMCLMGAYETLAKLTGLTSYAVFSEEVEPGQGNPYQPILDAIQANAGADGRTVAGIFVDEFNASYQGGRASTTLSAYELSQFTAFETALNALAGTLRSNLSSLAGAVGGAGTSAQAYEYPFLKDLVNFLDSLRVRTADPTLQSQIDAVKAQATGTFRVRSRFYNAAAAFGANDVSRSNGLTVLMPSGGIDDQLPDAGPTSFAAYQALYPGKAWTLFLADWVASQSTIAYRDQGNARFEAYLVWDSALVSRNGDVDMWILEPSGDLFIPYVGTVTPNGVLTNDSYDDGTFYEGYLTNRFLEIGEYKFYANLWIDPQDYRPVYDIQYRNDQVSALTSLYAPNYPQLSLQVSWLNDPTPTFGEADAGNYTDLQSAAILTVTAAAAANMSRSPKPPTLFTGSKENSARELTAAQAATIQRISAERRANRGSTQRRGVPSLLTVPTGGRQ